MYKLQGRSMGRADSTMCRSHDEASHVRNSGVSYTLWQQAAYCMAIEVLNKVPI